MTAETLLRNCWYAAARADEVTPDAPFARTMLGEPIVLFRRMDGAIAALEDRCPHRKAPLSLGRRWDGKIQCNYHGARFNGDKAGAAARKIVAQLLAQGNARAAE